MNAIQEREQRMDLVPQGAHVRGLIFNAVFKLVGDHRGESIATELRARVSKKPLVDFFSYPARDFIDILYRGAELLVPEYGSVELAIRAFGEASIGGFFQSGVGRTLTSLMGGRDPKRLFSSSPTAYSTTVNYGRREYASLGDRRVRLHFRGDMQPVEFHQGVLLAALRFLGHEGQVSVHKLGLDEAEYIIEW